mmetsp:Transcript_30119/g.45918  ORF Transcript_30119/g.45918 Transcript_30119/m.45918 type:complete len:1314 (+) Transcript_30119:68-4009(+)
MMTAAAHDGSSKDEDTIMDNSEGKEKYHSDAMDVDEESKEEKNIDDKDVNEKSSTNGMERSEAEDESRSDPKPEQDEEKEKMESELNDVTTKETNNQIDDAKRNKQPLVEENGKEAKREKDTIEEKEEEYDEEGAFASFRKRKFESHTKTRKKQKKLSIKLSKSSLKNSASQEEIPSLVQETKNFFGTSPYTSSILPTGHHLEDDKAVEEAFERSLAFYAETHEDQDPKMLNMKKEKEKQRCQKELEQLAIEDKQSRKEIADIIQQQLREKQESSKKHIERLRRKAAEDEQRDLKKLLQLYNEKVSSNQNKIEHGIKLLSRRHNQEMYKQQQQHRQMHQQRGIPEQITNAEWAQTSQQLKEKYRRQMQEFNNKGEEVKNKCEQDYVREREKRQKSHARRKRDMEEGMEKVMARIMQSFRQQHDRYLKRHVQRINKKKNKIMACLNGMPPPSDKEATKAGAEDIYKKEEREELQNPIPIKSPKYASAEHKNNLEAATAAITRYKNRKAVLSGISKQLGVEIHNEGLWLSSLSDKQSDGKKESSTKADNKQDSVFIPCGLEAREVLDSIVCGEIPLQYGPDRFDFGEVLTSQGGCIKCVVTDLRTGESTASIQRAECVKEQEEEGLQELEKKVKQLTSLMAEADKNLQRAELREKECMAKLESSLKEVEKAKNSFQEFRAKYGGYFGPDGQPVKTASHHDQQKLAQASHRYKTNAETAVNQEKLVRKALGEAKGHSQKMQAIAKQTQKATGSASTLFRKKKALLQDKSKNCKQRVSETAESERASARVHEVIGSFKKTADRRREQLTQMRSSNASNTWLQGLTGVPTPLRKSLWYKLYRRRRQQIVLRPSLDFLVLELKKQIESSNLSKEGKNQDDKDILLRAEQLFLLAAHPVAPINGPLPNLPSATTNEPWAEPGWHVDLNITEEDRSRNILPCAPAFPLLRRNQAGISSTPGRQAAAFLNSSHTKSLSAPLSTVARAISLAETNPLVNGQAEYTEADPLNIPNEEMMSGYNFALRAPTKSSATFRRKSGSKVDELNEISAARKDDHQIQKQKLQQQQSKKSQRKSPVGMTSTQQAQPSRRSSNKSEKTTRRRQSKKMQAASEMTSHGQMVEPHQHRQQQAQVTQASATQQAPQVPNPSLLQQQAAAMGMRYPSQTSAPQQAGLDRQQQYSQQFLKPVTSPQHVTAQNQHAGHNLQQMQQAMPPQQHLLPQPPQQYTSPQQQAFQQRQMAQMRMLQQQQQQQQQQSRQANYSQGQQLQFFPPAMAQRQNSFAGHLPRGVLQHPSSRRSSQQQASNGDDQNDPLLMLNDMGGGP